MTKQYTMADVIMDIAWDMGEEDRKAKALAELGTAFEKRKHYAMPLSQTCFSAVQADKLRAIFVA